jgi:cytoskeletal protein RodZ
MRKRLLTISASVAVLAALAFGGATLASANSSSKPSKAKPAAAAPKQHKSAATDGDNIQQGDQTSPDPGAAATESATESSAATSEATGPDSDAAAQSAACNAAGITSDNVQYDSQTGCTLDTSPDNGQ